MSGAPSPEAIRRAGEVAAHILTALAERQAIEEEVARVEGRDA